MSELDIATVINFFKVDRDRAIDMITKGVNPDAIRNGIPLFGADNKIIIDKYNKTISDLVEKMETVIDTVKSEQVPGSKR